MRNLKSGVAAGAEFAGRSAGGIVVADGSPAFGAAHRMLRAQMDQAVRAQFPQDMQVCSPPSERRLGIFFSRFERSRSSSTRDLIIYLG